MPYFDAAFRSPPVNPAVILSGPDEVFLQQASKIGVARADFPCWTCPDGDSLTWPVPDRRWTGRGGFDARH